MESLNYKIYTYLKRTSLNITGFSNGNIDPKLHPCFLSAMDSTEKKRKYSLVTKLWHHLHSMQPYRKVLIIMECLQSQSCFGSCVLLRRTRAWNIFRYCHATFIMQCLTINMDTAKFWKQVEELNVL